MPRVISVSMEDEWIEMEAKAQRELDANLQTVMRTAARMWFDGIVTIGPADIDKFAGRRAGRD